MSKLIFCRDCNIVRMIGATDRPQDMPQEAPEAGTEPAGESDDFLFLDRHKNHALSELSPRPGSEVFHCRLEDSSMISYFEAEDGDMTYVVKKWRVRRGDPFSYSVAPGRIERTVLGYDIDEKALVRQAGKELLGRYLDGVQVVQFVVKYFQFVQELGEDEIRWFPSDADRGQKLLGVPTSDALERFLSSLEDKWDTATVAALRLFVANNSGEGKAMNIAARTEFRIVPERPTWLDEPRIRPVYSQASPGGPIDSRA